MVSAVSDGRLRASCMRSARFNRKSAGFSMGSMSDADYERCEEQEEGRSPMAGRVFPVRQRL